MTPKLNLRLACWMSEKKAQKLDWKEFEAVCTKHGYELYNVIVLYYCIFSFLYCAFFQVNLDKPLEDQGPIHVFLHKLTDIIASAKEGNEKASF